MSGFVTDKKWPPAAEFEYHPSLCVFLTDKDDVEDVGDDMDVFVIDDDIDDGCKDEYNDDDNADDEHD